MHRSLLLSLVVLLFVLVPSAAAQPARIERTDRAEPSAVTTAVPTSQPAQPSITTSTSQPLTTGSLTTTTTLSPTGQVTATSALSPTLPMTTTALASQDVYTATVIGYVREFGADKPLPDVDVVIGGVATTTGQDGRFGPIEVPLKAATEQVDGSADAEGYEPWSFQGIPLEDGKKLDVHIAMRRKGTATPVAPARPVPSGVGAPPQTIRVGLTGESECAVPALDEPIPVVEMPFTDYLRNVLPNEWYPTWEPASLDAGAVAVKQFAWYTAFIERKWSRQGYPFDVLDSTCDQRYIPGTYTQTTDDALRRTWALTLTRDGELFPTYYRAYDHQCADSGSEDCMGQRGSQERALAGWSGVQILVYYYQNVVVEGLSRQNPVFLPLVGTS